MDLDICSHGESLLETAWAMSIASYDLFRITMINKAVLMIPWTARESCMGPETCCSLEVEHDSAPHRNDDKLQAAVLKSIVTDLLRLQFR